MCPLKHLDLVFSAYHDAYHSSYQVSLGTWKLGSFREAQKLNKSPKLGRFCLLDAKRKNQNPIKIPHGAEKMWFTISKM